VVGMQYDDTRNNRGDPRAPCGGKAEAAPIAKDRPLAAR
jgi:hypothetical protein